MVKANDKGAGLVRRRPAFAEAWAVAKAMAHRTAGGKNLAFDKETVVENQGLRD